jgi:hypothetical protein
MSTMFLVKNQDRLEFSGHFSVSVAVQHARKLEEKYGEPFYIEKVLYEDGGYNTIYFVYWGMADHTELMETVK